MKKKSTYRISRTVLCQTNNQAGVTLLLALLLVLVASMLAAGIIFSTQTEIWTTGNYRESAQARYVAEAGAQQAANWITNNWTPPANFTGTGSQFNLTTFPALYVGGSTAAKIVLASGTMGTITDTYKSFDSTNDGKFTSAIVTTPFSGLNSNANVVVAAELLSATQPAGSTGPWQLKWKIISQGTVGILQPARVQVVEVISHLVATSVVTEAIPNFDYAVLATGTGCNVVQMTGGTGTNAYNGIASGNVGNSTPTLLGTGGAVASFGNVNITRGAYINGPVFSPDYNLGTPGDFGISGGPGSKKSGSGLNGGAACSSSDVWSVNEDNSGSEVGCTNNASCTNTTANMPTSLSSPSSVPDPTMPPVTANSSACTALPGGLCNGGSGGGGGCAATLPPSPAGTSYGQANFGSCAVITLQPGIYNFDTLLISNGATIIVPTNGSVVINVYNSVNSSTPFTTNGGTITNPGGDPNNLTFVYDGTGTINLNNGAAMFATIYAPHAAVTLTGTGSVYGAVVGQTFNFEGSGSVIYDTNLANETPHVTTSTTGTVTPPHLDEFSWSAF